MTDVTQEVAEEKPLAEHRYGLFIEESAEPNLYPPTAETKCECVKKDNRKLNDSFSCKLNAYSNEVKQQSPQ